MERTDQATHEQDKNETEKRHIKLHLKGKGSWKAQKHIIKSCQM